MLRKYFPLAVYLLCRFHVSNAFRLKIMFLIQEENLREEILSTFFIIMNSQDPKKVDKALERFFDFRNISNISFNSFISNNFFNYYIQLKKSFHILPLIGYLLWIRG